MSAANRRVPTNETRRFAALITRRESFRKREALKHRSTISGLVSLPLPVDVLHGLDGFASLPSGGALSVGNFDGVHIGHRQIIDRLRELDRPATTVVTFEPHPSTVLRRDVPAPRLTPTKLKRERLAEAGVTHLVELPPTSEVLSLSPEQFWEQLSKTAGVSAMVEGGNFRFGKKAAGDVETLRQLAAGSGVEIQIVEPELVTLPGLHRVRASSTLVRWLMLQGRVADAAALLGRPFTLRGTVVTGHQRGRTIGYPTANLDTAEQLLPADGVYSASTTVDGRPYQVALSIGTNPQFDGDRRQVEAYLLDFSGDLYGREMSVDVHSWLRGQATFPSFETFLEQMGRDVKRVELSA